MAWPLRLCWEIKKHPQEVSSYDLQTPLEPYWITTNSMNKILMMLVELKTTKLSKTELK